MTDFTADKVEIVEGLVCYDNDLKVVVVGEVAYVEHNENTGKDTAWYRVYKYDDSLVPPADGFASALEAYKFYVRRNKEQHPYGTFDGGRLSTTFRNYYGKVFHAPQHIPPAD